MKLFCQLSMKLKTFSVVSEPLIAAQIAQVAREVIDDARVYFDNPKYGGGPRSWPSYEAFLGFKIADAALLYQLNSNQIQLLVQEVYDIEHITCLDDREQRAEF